LFTKAKAGDTTSLIFLAKTRLGMSEKVEVEHQIPEATAQTLIQIAFRPPSEEKPTASGEPKAPKGERKKG
jgi:hypothetical protein